MKCRKHIIVMPKIKLSELGWFRCCCKRRMFTESQHTCRTVTAGTSRTPVDLLTVIDALTGMWTMPQKPV